MLNSFEPIIDKDCKVLVLGTMPGVQSLEKQQYYGNKQNAFWRIIYSLFNQSVSEDYEDKKKFLLEQHIALWDVLKSCERLGSADANIKNAIPNDFKTLFAKYPNIERVYFNGAEAEKLFRRHVKKNINADCLTFSNLPSTSPANTVRLEDKLLQWQRILCI